MGKMEAISDMVLNILFT